MKKRFWPFAFIPALLFMFTACTCPTRVETDYGTSVKLAKFNQILNSDAGKKPDPVMGLDGKAANATMDKYQKAFEKPAPEPAIMFNLGGSSK